MSSPDRHPLIRGLCRHALLPGRRLLRAAIVLASVWLAWEIGLVVSPPPDPYRVHPAGTRVLPKPFLHDDVTRLLREEMHVLPAGS